MNAKDRISPTTVYGLTYALFAESLSDPCRVDSIVTSMLRDIESRVEHSPKDACPPEDEDVYNYWMTYDKELGSTPRRAVEIRSIDERFKRERTV